MALQAYYTKAVDGSEVKLIETYHSYGETHIIFEDEDDNEIELTLEEFEEMIGEELDL
jgi:hypothetical protein